ncbi:MAG TPA: ATP-binding protein [Gemmatimonadaceae bacterium]|nr:ATP-binding protein [Gemmatimonadaceae bacterium]
MIKVVLTGSESTGKTELAHRLAAHLSAPLAEEFVRGYAASKQGPLGFADHGPIARGQMALEDAAVARATDIVILDTDLVSTVVYCEHYFGRCPEWIEAEARRRAADLYLLMQPDIPWIADGVRDRGHMRDAMHALFVAKLQQLGLAFVEVGGTREQRFDAALVAILSHVEAGSRTRRASR